MITLEELDEIEKDLRSLASRLDMLEKSLSLTHVSNYTTNAVGAQIETYLSNFDEYIRKPVRVCLKEMAVLPDTKPDLVLEELKKITAALERFEQNLKAIPPGPVEP